MGLIMTIHLPQLLNFPLSTPSLQSLPPIIGPYFRWIWKMSYLMTSSQMKFTCSYLWDSLPLRHTKCAEYTKHSMDSSKPQELGFPNLALPSQAWFLSQLYDSVLFFWCSNCGIIILNLLFVDDMIITSNDV